MKKLIIPILIFVFMAISAIGSITVTLDPIGALVNNSFQSSSSVTPNFKAVGNATTWSCKFYTNENGSNGVGAWTDTQTDNNVANNTNISFISRSDIADVSGIRYCWDIFCNSTGNPSGDWGGSSGNSTVSSCGNATASAMNYSIDTTNPSITLNFPTSGDGTWFTTNTSPRIGITPIDDNIDSCTLKSALNITTNNSGNYQQSFQKISNSGVFNVTNNTQVNFTYLNSSRAWLEKSNDDYKYEYTCNDSAGNVASLGSNFTFYVDVTLPTTFNFNTSLWKTDNRILFNTTTATDFTPQIGWNATEESNFSRYEVIYFRDAYGAFSASNDTRVNITTRTTLSANISTLGADRTYRILVTAYDLAGNARNMTKIGYKYSTDSTNRVLQAGWNLIGNLGNPLNLSDIRIWTGATTVSIWNATHEFLSHVDGGSYGGTTVEPGNATLIFLSSAITFSDMIWNTSLMVTTAHTMTNQSASGWNLAVMRNSTVNYTFGAIDKYVNCPGNGTGTFFETRGEGCNAQENNVSHIPFLSAYNNSASSGSKYIPFVANWSISNETTLEFGNTVWMFLDGTKTREVIIDWGAI